MEVHEILADIAGSAERGVRRGRRALARRIRGERPARVVAYRSYGTRDLMYVRGRVLHGTRPSPATPTDPWWVNLTNAYRRLESDEVPGARLRAHALDASADITADDEGYFRAELRPVEPPPDSRLWHPSQVDLLDPEGEGAIVPVAIPVNPRFGVISDLDDTVLETDVRNVVRMGREVLFGNAHTRIPFPGVGAFYRALHQDANPLFYVSSSPWSLYDLLSQFLHLHRIPAGPMDLRDWDLSLRPRIRGGHQGHKRAAIDRILGTYPDLPFILVGDSGQEDPEIYRGVVHDHPDRVLAIYIRSVVADPIRIDSVEALSRELNEHDIDLLLAHDTLDAARHAADRGWIAAEAIEEVAADRALEEELA